MQDQIYALRERLEQLAAGQAEAAGVIRRSLQERLHTLTMCSQVIRRALSTFQDSSRALQRRIVDGPPLAYKASANSAGALYPQSGRQ